MNNKNKISNEEALDEVESHLAQYLEFAEAIYEDARMIEKQINDVFKNPQKKLLNEWLKEPARERLLYWKERTEGGIQSGDIVDVFDSLEEAIIDDGAFLPYQISISEAVGSKREAFNKASANCRRLQRGRNR